MADTIAQMTKGEFKEMLETLLNPLIEQKLLEILGVLVGLSFAVIILGSLYDMRLRKT